MFCKDARTIYPSSRRPQQRARSARMQELQSLCKSLGEKVRTKPLQNHTDELLLGITSPSMGKTTRRELSPIKKGMVIAFFWFFAKSLLLVSLQAALGQPLKTSFSRLQNAVISRTSLNLGDPFCSDFLVSSISYMAEPGGISRTFCRPDPAAHR